ncbi:MAG TPA: ABC transporter permease [Vicinamibacterales bacterium]|nr:ABC transporter permease [Vicinamibacterales bacterium]
MTWRRFFNRRRRDEDLQREIASYIALETDDNIARGMSPPDAHDAAVRKFGNVTRVREDVYVMNTMMPLDTLWQDVRLAVRLLRRDKGFTIAAILSLALGIGANTALFQLLDVVRLRSLPVAAPDRLVKVSLPPGSERSGSFSSRWPEMTFAQFEEIGRHQRIFTGLFAWSSRGVNTADGGIIREVDTLWLSGDAFGVLGVRPELGRVFGRDDDRPGCAPIALISHAYWQRALGGDASVLSRTIRLEGTSFEIVGVTTPGFYGLDVGRRFDVAIPLCTDPLLNPSNRLETRRSWWLSAVGRLPSGVSARQATEHLKAIAPAVMKSTVPPDSSGDGIERYLANTLQASPLLSGVSDVRDTFGTILIVLLAGTAIVLLIACANLASLLLARGTARQKEIAVRLAIGASRRRVVRQLLVESAILVAAGVGAGTIVARGLTSVVVTQLADGMGPVFLDIQWNLNVLGFTAGIAALTCLLCGLAPALKATALAPAAAMRADGRGTTQGPDRFRFRRLLLIGQVGLSVVLLLGAVLFTRTLYNLLNVNVGFDQQVVVAGLSHRSLAEGTLDERQLLRERLRDAIAAHPAVADVAASRNQPLSGRWWNDYVYVDVSSEKLLSNFNRVSPNYFRMLGIPILKGRNFLPQDVRQAPAVAVVSDAFARKAFPTGDALGHTLWIETPPGQPARRIEIVGIAADAKYEDIRSDFEPVVHLPAAQDDELREAAWFVVKPRGPIDDLPAAIEQSVAGVNPAIALHVTILSRQVREGLLRERLMAGLSVAFGSLAALLAAIGLYGVMSYMVTRRSSEFGIRMALGAHRRDVVRIVVGEAGVVVAIGLAIGIPLGLGAAAAARSLLFGLEPTDPATIAIAVAFLAAIGLLAAYLPARRASRLDPVEVLRME